MKSAGSNKLAADAALLGLILDSAGEGIVFRQSDKMIGYINQAGREILRCAPWSNPLLSLTELITFLGFDPPSITPKDIAAGKPEGVALHLAAQTECAQPFKRCEYSIREGCNLNS